MLKKIISHSFVYAVAPQVSRIVSIFILPLLTAHLTPLDYGVSASILVYTGLFSGIKDLGITVLLVNAFYHHPRTWQLRWRIFYGYLLAWAPLLFLVQFFFILFVCPKEVKPHMISIGLLTSLPILLFDHTILVGFRYLHVIKRNVTYLGIASVASGLTIVACNYITIVHMKMGYMGWFWSTFIGTAVSMLFYCKPVFADLKLKPIFFKSKEFFRRQMQVSLPMIPHNYSTYLLNSSDRLVMRLYNLDINNIGVYNLASTFGNYFEVIGSSMGFAISPFINDLLAEKKMEAELRLRKLIYLFQAVFLLGSVLVCLWLKEIFHFLIRNTELQAGYALAIIVIMGYCYRPMYWGSINRLIFYKLTGKLWRISFIAGLLNIVLNLIFIPIYGYTASVYITFVSLIFLGFSGYYLPEFRKISSVNYRPLAWIIIISVSTCIVFLCKDLPVSFRLTITGSILVVMTWAVIKYRSLINLNK